MSEDLQNIKEFGQDKLQSIALTINFDFFKKIHILSWDQFKREVENYLIYKGFDQSLEINIEKLEQQDH